MVSAWDLEEAYATFDSVYDEIASEFVMLWLW